MVRKTVDKSIKQIVNVKVHVGEHKRKAVKRKKRVPKGRSGGGVGADFQNAYAQSFNPVYIQSGEPPHLEKQNPLLDAISNLTNNIKIKHEEESRSNSLLNSIKKERRSPGIHNETKEDDFYLPSSTLSSGISSISGSPRVRFHDAQFSSSPVLSAVRQRQMNLSGSADSNATTRSASKHGYSTGSASSKATTQSLGSFLSKHHGYDTGSDPSEASTQSVSSSHNPENTQSFYSSLSPPPVTPLQRRGRPVGTKKTAEENKEARIKRVEKVIQESLKNQIVPLSLFSSGEKSI